MYITKLVLSNIRGFIKANISFSKSINILVGQNNSGKSTILNAIHLLEKDMLTIKDIRLKQSEGSITIDYIDPVGYLEGNNSMVYKPTVNFTFDNKKHLITMHLTNLLGHGRSSTPYTNKGLPEPNNIIYPYLSKRKVTQYAEDINSTVSYSVTGNFQHLYAKIDKLSDPQFLPAHEEYNDACMQILGYVISAQASPQGKRAVLNVQNNYHIPMSAMGEGVANILGLIVDLCVAENQIFLIEEPENDIHPTALKALLELIKKKSATNQFFISTHSNIVTKYLGSDTDASVFKVSMQLESRMPVSEIKKISTPSERREVLEELGYELDDSDLWNGWLFLEEASAETIIKQFLIPWFVPTLQGKLRTFSTKGVDAFEVKFNSFNDLFVFLHLEPTYKNKAWVIVDSGEKEKKILDSLKVRYNSWNEDNFRQLTEHDFEKYYPAIFKRRVDEVLAISEKDEKKTEKKNLLEEVITWIDEDKARAKKELSVSAKEVINILKEIAVHIK